jgi:hypothetical protein
VGDAAEERLIDTVKVTRHGESVRIRLGLAEAHVLEQLLTELQEFLEPDVVDASDPVQKRLYPAAYDDDADAAAYRELTESSLRQERRNRADECLADLRDARSLVRTDITMSGAEADRWIRVLNDLRLALGTRLDISEDDDYELRPGDPDVHLRARYVWLTALQDMLVTTLLG